MVRGLVGCPEESGSSGEKGSEASRMFGNGGPATNLVYGVCGAWVICHSALRLCRFLSFHIQGYFAGLIVNIVIFIM